MILTRPRRAYISISYGERKRMIGVSDTMIEILGEFKIEPFIFVDHYSFDSTQEREMMLQAVADIDKCDFLIAETSEKAIGVGIEVGYAKGINKPVIYVRATTAEHSTTVSGISDAQVIYDDLNDLRKKLSNEISRLFHQT